MSPSSAALKLAFSRRSDEGGEAGISRHQATVSRSRSASGTTVLTSPICERLLGVVQAAQEPDLLRLAWTPTCAREQPGAEAAVEAADPGAGLPEDGVVGGDRQVADQVQDVAAADRVAGDHRDHRLRQAADLHVQVADVEPADALLGDLVVADVAVVAADPLVAAGAERLGRRRR